MGIENFLAPGENVRFKSPGSVEYMGDNYPLYITDRRIIWFKTTGKIFKKNSFVSYPIEEVKNISYMEKGVLRKKGIIKLSLPSSYHEFTGDLGLIKDVYSEMQSYMLGSKKFTDENK